MSEDASAQALEPSPDASSSSQASEGLNEPTDIDWNELLDDDNNPIAATDAPVDTPAETPAAPVAAVAAPAPAAATVVAAGTPAQSPYATDVLTPAEREKAQLLLDNEQFELVQTFISRAIAADRTAQAQQRSEARKLGLTPEVLAEYGDDIEKYAPAVPKHLQGTQDGVMVAAFTAIGNRVKAGASFNAEMKKFTALLDPEKPKPVATAPVERRTSTPPAPLPASANVGRAASGGVGAANAGAQQQRGGVTRQQKLEEDAMAAICGRR